MESQKPGWAVVLDAYAEAYPDGLKIEKRNADIKYYPSRPKVSNQIFKEFVEANGDENQIKEIKVATKDSSKTNSFSKKGYFTLTDEGIPANLFEDDATGRTFFFNRIQGLPTETARQTYFFRALTIIYAAQDADDTQQFFFDPVGHVEKADSLKKTVDIMIRSKNAAARGVGSV